MTKKRLVWVCLIVSPLLLGGALFCLCERDPITQANCDRIKKGMTEKEVQALLGKKADYSFSYVPLGLTHCWKGSRGRIEVQMTPFFVDHAVFTPDSRTILEKIRNLLGL